MASDRLEISERMAKDELSIYVYTGHVSTIKDIVKQIMGITCF